MSKRKVLAFLLLTFIAKFSLGQQMDPSENWQTYSTFDGIEVSFKLDNCTGVQGINGNEVKLVLRFSNTSQSTKTISWRPQWYRDGSCVNCQNINSNEFDFSLELQPGEVKEGSACNKDKRFYMFSHWKNVVQGMDHKRLTNFEFINTEVTENL